MVFGVSIIAFGLTYLTGDPAEVMLGTGADFMTRAQIDEFRHAMGFDRPWFVQICRFRLARGARRFRPLAAVPPAVFRGWCCSASLRPLQLAVLSLLLSVVLAIPPAVLAATRPNSVYDNLGTLLSLAGQSIPGFALGILLMLLFGVTLHWLPISGRGTWQHMILPAVTLSAFPAGT